MKACYPVAMRGKSVVWSGVPFHGPEQFKDAIEFYAQSAASRAVDKGYPGKKKGDAPGFTWLEAERDALFNNNAIFIKPGDNDKYQLITKQESTGSAVAA